MCSLHPESWMQIQSLGCFLWPSRHGIHATRRPTHAAAHSPEPPRLMRTHSSTTDLDHGTPGKKVLHPCYAEHRHAPERPNDAGFAPSSHPIHHRCDADAAGRQVHTNSSVRQTSSCSDKTTSLDQQNTKYTSCPSRSLRIRQAASARLCEPSLRFSARHVDASGVHFRLSLIALMQHKETPAWHRRICCRHSSSYSPGA